MIECKGREFVITCSRCGQIQSHIYKADSCGVLCKNCISNVIDELEAAVKSYKQEITQAGNHFTKFRGYKALKNS